jgi:hypothetical protein
MSDADDRPPIRPQAADHDDLDAFLMVVRQALLMIAAWIEQRQRRRRKSA